MFWSLCTIVESATCQVIQVDPWVRVCSTWRFMAYIKNANIDLININLYVFLILGRPTVGTDPEPWVNLNDPAGGAFDAGTEVPEHALKIYKTDQQFKYLLVHQETRAEDVVKLALLEFGISEMKSNYSLYKVTVKVNILFDALPFWS